MNVPPWAPAVQRLPDGQWQPVLLVTDPVPTEEEAHELALYLVRQLDARLRDVGAQLDASTAYLSITTAASVPLPAFTSA